MKPTKYVEDYCRDLKFKNYCERTIQNYSCQVSLFLNKFSHLNDPKRITEFQIKNWVSEAKTINSVKHRLSALKLFYKYTIKQPMKLRWVEYPRAERKLPIPLEMSDIQKMIEVCQNLKQVHLATGEFSGYWFGCRCKHEIRLTEKDAKLAYFK